MIFTVTGKIRGKGRPRFGGGHIHTDENTRMYESLIRSSYKDQGGILYSSAVSVRVAAGFAIPKSTSKENRRLMSENIIRPTKKPDIDNILKVVLDALNGIAYADDRLVIAVYGEKFYVSGSECLMIEVKPIDA